MAATNLGADGNRYVKFWVDSSAESLHEEHDLQQMFEGQSTTDPVDRRHTSPVAETPVFGDQPPPPEESYQYRPSQAGQIPVFGGLRQHVPGTHMASPITDLNGSCITFKSPCNMPIGCSLMSMEPLREWLRKGADVTSPVEFEAALP